MIDTATVRRIALALPEAEERSHHQTPDFRVRNKIFATLRADQGRAVLKLPIELHQTLVQTNPDCFALNAWSKQGWIEVDLAHVSEDEIEALMEEAWSNVAPRRMVTSWIEAR